MKKKSGSTIPRLEDRIAERLRDARVQLKLTQAQLAEKAGLSRSAIVHYERGNAAPGAVELVKLANVLGKVPNYLLSGSDAFFPSQQIDHLLTGNNPMEIVAKIALCLNVLPRDVMESVSALLVGLVRARLPNDEYEGFLRTLKLLRAKLPAMATDIDNFAGEKATAITKSKPKRSTRSRS